MASNLDLVYQNFIDTIEALTPTSAVPGKNFYHQDFKRIDPLQSPGLTRAFSVFWLGSEADFEPTDMSDRWCDHMFEIQVAYSTEYPLATQEKLIAQDRHDITKALRTDANYISGLHRRVRKSERVDMGNAQVWYLKQTWLTTVQETE